MTARVIHGGYGCETGCCGHRVVFDGHPESFFFDHPWGTDPRQWAEALVATLAVEWKIAEPITLVWDACDVLDELHG